MAKDGTNRGGARPGSGRKPKALKEKIDSGNPGRRRLTKLDIPESIDGVDMPTPGDYLSAEQRDGKPLGADRIYTKTFTWLKKLGCEKLINPQLVEQYAMSVARWTQCEEAISQLGLVAKSKSTGNAVTSPFVTMGQSYMKQSNILWNEIFRVVRENCVTDVLVDDKEASVDMMELLLRKKGT